MADVQLTVVEDAVLSTFPIACVIGAGCGTLFPLPSVKYAVRQQFCRVVFSFFVELHKRMTGFFPTQTFT